MKKNFYLFVFLLTNAVIAIGFFHRIVKGVFGIVTLDQIIFNLQGTGGVLDKSAWYQVIFWMAVFGIVFVIHTIIFINFVWKRKPVDEMVVYRIIKFIEEKLVEILKHSPRYIYLSLCVITCALIFNYIEKRYHVIEFVNKPESEFIAEHYKIPEVTFKKKRNLVLVFLESMERGYTNESIFGKNLIPDLQELAKNNTSFIGHEETEGSHWTQAAHVNMLMGLPLLYASNQTSKVNTFMPGAVSITDVLKKHGYKIYSLFGATGRFADMKKLFQSHGVDNVWERDYYDEQGYDKPENIGTNWGYKDSFIYDKMIKLYEKLYAEKEPFCMIMRTVDTHFPHGFAEKEYREFGDIRDTFVQANRMSMEFIKKIKEIGIENTTIIFVGDHLWMDKPGITFTEKLMPQLKDRQIFNVFINSSAEKEWLERYRSYAAFDMAPTILESIGAELEGRQFGLGTSLFSHQKTLVERYGVSYINEEFKKFSSFYGKLVNDIVD